MRFYKDPPPISQMTEEELKAFLIRCQVDYHYFCEVVLGFHDMNEVHKDLCHFVQHDKHLYKLLLLPRLTFKSSILTQGYALWAMNRNPNISILIYSDSTIKAQGFLRGIKSHIEGKAPHSRFREFLGDWIGKEVWNEYQIVVSKRRVGTVSPTVDTAGIDASKVGLHYDIILFDDIVSDTNVGSKAMLDKTYDCYKKALSLLTRNGEIIITGTRWHIADMYGQIIEENKRTDMFGVVIKDAEAKRENGGLIFDNIGKEALTQRHLDILRQTQKRHVYTALYRNNPVGDDDALFLPDKFHFYGSIKRSDNPYKNGLYENLFITATVDPAGEGADRTGGVVVGTDRNMKMHILEILNKHLMPNQIIDWVLEMNYKYKLRLLGIETRTFQHMLRREIEKRVGEEKIANPEFNVFGIREFTPSKGESKFLRISALQPWHERGDILFPGESIQTQSAGFSDLVYQMLQVTQSHMPEPNDILDALAYQILIVRPGGDVEKDKLPKNSPAWLEQKWVSTFNKEQRMLPRKARRHYQAWLS